MSEQSPGKTSFKTEKSRTHIGLSWHALKKKKRAREGTIRTLQGMGPSVGSTHFGRDN